MTSCGPTEPTGPEESALVLAVGHRVQGPPHAFGDAAAVEAEALQDVVRLALGDVLPRDPEDPRDRTPPALRFEGELHGVDEEGAGTAVAAGFLGSALPWLP